MSCDDGVDYSLNMRLDNISPDFKAYIDVSRFIGKEIAVSVAPVMDIVCEEADEIDILELYREPYRPQIHFSTKNGWINDPNGMIYADGKYHLFYQHNPCEPMWENMHWGHAVSDDMLHWREEDIALFPDKTGMMYSGSAVVDEDNLLGLQTSDEKTIVVYYTATQPYEQYMAYSTDGLKTLKKTDKPTVPNIFDANRDPKVIFCEEWDAYAMALYIIHDRFNILRSKDLVHWEIVQELRVEGENECPDIFPLIADNGERKWVFIGAHDRYLVGDMRDDGFYPTQEVRSLHFGKSAYAGQSFSGLPDGRIVRMDWMRWYIPTPNINGQMSMPADMSLSYQDGIYYLCAMPIKEIESLYEENIEIGSCELSAGVAKTIPLSIAPYTIKLKIDKDLPDHLELMHFGRRVVFGVKENKVIIGDNVSPLTFSNNGIDLVMIADRCSLELYLDGGRIYIATVDVSTFCDDNLPYFEIVADKDCKAENLEIHSMRSIWEE